MSTKSFPCRSILRKYAGIAVILGCGILCRADSAQDILNRALEQEKNGTYEAVLVNDAGRMLQRANKDGTISFRLELGGAKGMVTIKNSGGTFLLFPASRQAVRDADNDNPEPNYDKYATCAMAEGEYEKIPCYIVTRDIPVNDKTFKIFRDWFEGTNPNQSTGEMRKIFKESFAAREIFWIGKENNAIYVKACYSNNGKFLQEAKFSKINLNPSLPDNLFEIPAGYTIKRAIDGPDFAEALGGIVVQEAEQERDRLIASQQPGFWSTLPQSLGRGLSWLWEWLLAYGSWLFLAIAIATVTVIAVMKWKDAKRA